MKKGSIIFLQIVIVLIGIGTLTLMLWEPHLEGRNAQATLFEIYFKDPFLAYAYLASVPAFVGLYQAFKVFGSVRKNKTFTQENVKAFRIMKYCAMALITAVAGAEAYFFIAMRGKDDIAGGVAVGLIMIFIFVVIASAAAVCEKLLQNAVDLKSENDLTV